MIEVCGAGACRVEPNRGCRKAMASGICMGESFVAHERILLRGSARKTQTSPEKININAYLRICGAIVDTKDSKDAAVN